MARIERSNDGEQIELFIDGEFVASWKHIELTNLQRGIICNMVDQAVSFGERKKSAEIRKVIGAK